MLIAFAYYDVFVCASFSLFVIMWCEKVRGRFL